MSFKHKTLMAGSVGLNNSVDPMRLFFDQNTGFKEMATAVNIDIDARQRISRRKGYALAHAVAAHSLFSVGSYALFVSGNALSVLEKDYTHTAIRNVTPGARMSYVNVDGKVYYANGSEVGYVSNRLSYAWVPQAYVGPQTNKEFVAPPVGHLLALYRGRMYIAVLDGVYYSEPFAYSWFNLSDNYFKLPGYSTMMESVKDGLFISTEDGVWFYDGSTPKEFMLRQVTDYPAIKGTTVNIRGRQLNEVVQSENVLLWTSQQGICMGLDGGRFANLTEQRLVLPTASLGASGYLNGKYVVTLEP